MNTMIANTGRKCGSTPVSVRKQPRLQNTTSFSHTQPFSSRRDSLALSALPGTFLSTGVAQASEIFSTASTVVDSSSISLAVVGGLAIAGLGAVLVATDPQKRRSEQMAQTGGDESEAVKNYFNTVGFERWRKIYGETDEVNRVQLDIRNGHAKTVEKVLGWLYEEGGVEGVSVCDAGCGTGSLAVPLATRGATVSASDISAAMVGEAQKRYEEQIRWKVAPSVPPKFEAMGLESITGKYHTVTCLDVMIHYPQDRVNAMIDHLTSLCDNRLIISFAPYTIGYAVLKRIGELFPGPSKATRAYLHAESDVEAALARNGFKIVKREMTATSFYFSRLLEAVRE
ncbi:hypothetical protein CEUSTIGMA_g11372.t1 [Chlamydomonas eustigma]|uniref:Magnesium-protoporphyrin IX methyltransferase C-terminal domain-containing protein n=1 Tax=Chlamydomonas eustigma TaxID=1157962 RepID=A0A250XLJ5_9CHLO|nr:hypothetical protein CEUSTIGMA_g11372.t1 [Chlamydomonas eustigma]|eukprot:GAX83948.1 hypothetical protein CEUSTIGMA_g11372.t1 [Chlamydomonas eustigma]